nr:beta-lactamase domain-containing protein 2-like [Tanacetum cinerariifolium]
LCAYKEGEVIIDTAAGVLGKDDPRPVQQNSLFPLYSVTKGVTAGMVHWLADKGDTIQLEKAVSTIYQEYLLEFTSEYDIPKSLDLELPGPTDPTVEFPEGKVGVYTKFFEFANFRIPILQFLFDILGHYQIQLSQLVFPTVMDWCTSAPKDQMPSVSSYSASDVTILNTRRTPIQKQPEALLCLVGLSRRYFLGDDVYPTFLYDDDRDMDLFSLITAPNPAKVKIRTRPRAAHEVPLLTVTANRVIDMEDMTGTSGSSGTSSTVEKSLLDFSYEDPPPLITERIRTEEQRHDELSKGIAPAGNPPYTKIAPEPDLEKGTVAMGALVNKRRRKRGPGEAKANAPPKVLRKDHVASHPSQTKGVSDPDPLSYAKPPPAPESSKKAVVTEDPDSEKSTSFTSMVGSPKSIYQPRGVTNNCRLDTSNACQDMVDHIVPPGYFSELRHFPNDEFLNQYNTTLARQVSMVSELRLRFEQETKLLKKAVAQVARRDQRIQAREKHIKNLEALLEAEADMKDIAEAKNVKLVKELESLRVQIKAAFEEFKKYKDDRVSSRCAEIDARLDALSIDFDEELYPQMLTAIVELRQVFTDVVSARIAKGMSEGLKHGVEHGKAKVDLAAIEAYDPEADTKYVTALHALKDLKY